MTSLATRLAAAIAAGVTAFSLVACSAPADTAEKATGDERIPESAVITGEPAGHNADDVAFATDMVPHHQQAIELSELVPERSTDPELVALASKIAAEQQPEINILNVFLVQWNENPEAGVGSEGDHAGHGQTMQGMVDDATMARLESLRGPEFDTLWLQSMIGHHQGAVEMAKAEIANGENVDAISMAKTMVTAQEADIAQMKSMLEGTP